MTAAWARGLTADELEQAQKGFSERAYAKGSYVCHVGDRFDHWAGVTDGLVKLSAISCSGKPLTFTGINAGGWFGEGSILKDERRKYDVVAVRDTRLAMLHKTSFFWLYENSLTFNRYLLHLMNVRMGQFVGAIEYQRFLCPAARIARSLYWLFNPVLCPNAGSRIEITQEELGLLSGVSRQSANQGLSLLEKKGLIARGHGIIVVKDVEGLAKYE